MIRSAHIVIEADPRTDVITHISSEQVRRVAMIDGAKIQQEGVALNRIIIILANGGIDIYNRGSCLSAKSVDMVRLVFGIIRVQGLGGIISQSHPVFSLFIVFAGVFVKPVQSYQE